MHPSAVLRRSQVRYTALGRWRLDDIREPMVRLHAEYLAEHSRLSAKCSEDLCAFNPV